MAEAVTRRLLSERGWSHVGVGSAGTSALPNARASEGARRAAEEIGLDLSEHRSRPLTEERVAEADIVVVMTTGHVRPVEELGGGSKVALLTDFLQDAPPGEGIEDPFGGTAADFARARDRIHEAAAGLLDRLSAILAP
jgi:protein-tyrosine-phosphatase